MYTRSQVMFAPQYHIATLAVACLVGALLLTACSNDAPALTSTPSTSESGVQVATIAPTASADRPTATVSPPPGVLRTVGPDTPVPEAATSTPEAPEPEAPTSQPEPTGAPAEPTTAPQSQPEITFQPAELPLGGASVVYLNRPASAATMSFGGRQYPMLPDGDRWWAIVGVDAFAEAGLAPVEITYQPTDGGEAASVAATIPIAHREFPVDYIELDPDTASLLDPEIVNAEAARLAAVHAGYTTQRHWSGAFVPPSNAPISSSYGNGRSFNGGPVSGFHGGTDFAADTGTPVFAAGAGQVVLVDELNVRGNAVIIDHGAGVFTGYHHLSAFSVQEGDTVAAGDPIGAIGSTGLVTGPHLHWEVIVRGVLVDGQLWLTGSEYGP